MSQYVKASFPIDVRVLGSVMELRELQLENAFCPIEVRVFGKVIELRSEH